MSKQSNKMILKESEVRAKILNALEKVCYPVMQTIGPQGKNVLFDDALGNVKVSNDGVTIIKNIELEDPLENAIANMVKSAANKTNQEAGDATSTTVLETYVMTTAALELKNKGIPQRHIRNIFNGVVSKILKRLEEKRLKISSVEDEQNIATISANNDSEIAKDVVSIVNGTGEDGMVFLDIHPEEKTEIEFQTGFKVPTGVMYQPLYTDVSKPVIQYEAPSILILDKKLYYAKDAEHIIRQAITSGIKSLVIVAKDFLADSLSTLIANHAHGTIKVVLVKLDDDIALQDLAVYCDTVVISEQAARRIDSIVPGDFKTVKHVYADPQKVLIKHESATETLEKRVASLKEELKKDKDNQVIKRRLASMTSGIANVKIGGRTIPEAFERMYRYEDAISALRAAKRDGYLIGGGVSLFVSYNEKDFNSKVEKDIASKICKASLERLAENSGIDIDYDKIVGTNGFNALSGEYEDLLQTGVIEPFKAVEMSLKNSLSVADSITSLGSFILYERNKDDGK